MTNPWLDPSIAAQQRALVDAQLQQSPSPVHFRAFAEAIRATQCPGDLLVVGCGVGHEREILDRSGVEYRRFAGIDISPAAIALARERYPESDWACADFDASMVGKSDVVVDSACLMHVDDWRAHLAALCAASRRWVILHRVPLAAGMALGTGAERRSTTGYGHEFPAWRFGINDLVETMKKLGAHLERSHAADGDSMTLTFAKPRHFVSYADGAYLTRLKALHASMVRHCGSFELHVLAWDQKVADWCASAPSVSYSHIDGFLADVPSLRAEALPGPPRTRVEHMWTVGPAWLSEIMAETGEPVTYVDADVMFFFSPEPVFAEIGGASAAVVPHGFAEASRGLPGPTRQTHEVFGRHNVGVVYAADQAFVERWASQCREWCYDHLEQRMITSTDDSLIPAGIKYGDQKYLEDWEDAGAHVIQHPGACLGPWAVHTRALDVRDGVIYFGNRPLVSYHFSSYREGPHGQEQLSRPEYALTERQAEVLYAPYVRALQEVKR